MIARIRRGNDFKHVWAITWNGQPEDFSDATDITLTAKVYGQVKTLTEGVDYHIDGGTVMVDFTPAICDITGTYNLELNYVKPSAEFIDGNRRSVIDINAFQIVASSDDADTTGDTSSTSDAAIGLPGKSAYQIAVDNGFDGTQAEWLESLIGADGASGNKIIGVSIVGDDIVYHLNEGEDITMTNGRILLRGEDGVAVSSAAFVDNDLVFTLSDNSSVIIANAKSTLKGDALSFEELTEAQKSELRGAGITSIEQTASSGSEKTYTITYGDSQTTTFTVNDGNDGHTPVISFIGTTVYVDGVAQVDLKGDTGSNIELQKTATHVQWRVVGGSWANLIPLSDLKGEQGDNISMQKTTTHIQWRLGTGAWNNLVALTELKGDTGANIELQKSATHVQWRVQGTTTWNNLILIEDLKVKGDTGANIELQKSTTHVQWRVVGTSTWNNLVSLSELKGEAGYTPVIIENYWYINGVNTGVKALGENGLQTELQKTTTHIQWRVVGGSWTNLVALSELKGDTGQGLPSGGLTGQQLVKKSATDYDFEWQTPAGAGDMLKSVYDSDGDGIVDNAEKVNNHTVDADVPTGAKFTDTIYSHPATHPYSMITGAPTSLPANGGDSATVNGKTVEENVPAGAKFTDTVYSHPNHTGDVTSTGDGATVIGNDTVTNTKLANMPATTIKGNNTGATADPKDLTPSEVRAILNVADGANNYSHPTSDGNLHVPATGTTNDGKVLKAGATAGSLAWGTDNDTITTINGKTGVITKADIVALGIPAQDTVYTHPAGTNPHGTTKADVGLGNVDNTSDADKPVSTAQASAIDEKYTKPALGIPKTDLVTDVQTSLGKADTALQSFTETDPTVPSWAKQTNKPAYTATEVGAIPASQKGANNGVAELDSTGKVLSSQLPSYVDDVLEYATSTNFPTTGETGKIYVAINTNLTYRWTGTAYTEISPSIALGETSSTAYRGDKGKTAYDHSQTSHAPADAQKNSDITKAEIEAKLTGEITSHTHAYASTSHTHNATDINDGTLAIARIPTGTTSSTVALGNHTHSDYVPTSRTVAGKALTDNITLAKGDVGLGSVDNTSDANKPVSTAQQTALNAKMDSSKFQVVESLPASPVSGTFYFVKE